MVTVENYDGLCGRIALFASHDNQICCTYYFGHQGSCSWTKIENHFKIMGGTYIKRIRCDNCLIFMDLNWFESLVSNVDGKIICTECKKK